MQNFIVIAALVRIKGGHFEHLEKKVSTLSL